jgi:hypothetical protein
VPTIATRHLETILQSLSKRELDSLVTKLDLRIDRTKRIDPAQQVARLLLAQNDAQQATRLPSASRDLLHRIAEAHGCLRVDGIPASAEPLMNRGLVYVSGTAAETDLMVPLALLLQMRSWDGEDPRSVRALLAQASPDAQSAIAGYYLGRTAVPPVALALESALEALWDKQIVKRELRALAPSEQRVLEAIERCGGEVYTDELLELEREPLRLRTTTGAATSRRGVGFSLERRGLLIPLHPNRHVIPTEVSQVLSHNARASRQTKREAIRGFVAGTDNAPRRANFSADPSGLAIALALALRETQGELKQGVGTPKSLVQKLALRFGREPEEVALLAALSRSVGLWDVMALHPGSPPGEYAFGQLFGVLWQAYRRGGAWDEGRSEAETMRLALDHRDASPANAVRLMVFEAFADLAVNENSPWIPWESLARYLAADDRLPSIERLFQRWAARVNVPNPTAMQVAERIVLHSLPALGMLDTGEADDGGRTLRLTPRGRALLADTFEPTKSPSRFLDSHVLRLGTATRIADILLLAPFTEIGKLEGTLDLIVAPQTLARALSSGLDADALRKRIEAVAALPDTLSQTLNAASVVVGRIDYIAAQGFLWIEDVNLRDLLRTRRITSELFVDPSPTGGLLVAAGVELEKLVKRCRTLGIEIVHEGAVLRAQTLPPPAVQQSRVTPFAGTRTPKRKAE